MKNKWRSLSAVCLWPKRYGQTVVVSPTDSSLKEWLGYFHGDSPDDLCVLFLRDELYFGPPDVYTKLGL